MKKTLAALLCLLMALSMMPVFAEEAPKVLTMATDGSVTEFWNYEVFQKVQEELNMTIEMTQYDGESFNAMLASGEMADVMFGGTIATILENDLALNLYPLLEKYAPSMLSDSYIACVEMSRSLMGGEDDGFYIIMPAIGMHNYMAYTGTDQVQRGYVVDWEYYREIGCPPIESDEDYIDVLYQMWQNHPTDENGEPTYMFGTRGSLGNLTYRGAFLADVAVNRWTEYFFCNSIFTNELVNCYTNTERSHYWSEMEFLNKIYNMGGLDPDLFTITGDEYNAKRDTRAYMGLYQRSGDYHLVVPSNNMVTYNNLLMAIGNCPNYFSWIPKNSDNVELALQFFNYIYDADFARTWYSGVEGKDWNYDENGVPSLTEEALASRAAMDTYWAKDGLGYGQRIGDLSGYNPAVTHPDGYPMDLSFTREAAIAKQTEMERDFCEAYGVEFFFDAFTNREIRDFRNDAGENISSVITDIPKDIQRILSSCDDVLFTYAPELIMAADAEEYQAIQQEVLAELEALNIQEAWEWYSAAWEEPKSIFTDYLAENLPKAGLELYTPDQYTVAD